MLQRLRWPDEEPLFAAPAVGWAGVQAHHCAVNESRSPQLRRRRLRLERPLAGDLWRLVSVRLVLRRAAYASLGSLGPFPPNPPLSSMRATRALHRREAVVALSFSLPLIFLMVEVVASAQEL